MVGEATPPVEAQVESAPLSDLPVAQPYNAPPVPPSSEPVVSHPEPHQPSPPPELAPVFDSRRNRFVDPATQKIVRDPTKWPKEPEQAQVAEEPPPVEPPAAVVPPPVAPAQHTPLTLHLARTFGIPEHIIAATPTADLRAEIALLQQQPTQNFQPPPPAEDAIDWGMNPATNKPFVEADFDEFPLHKQMVRQQHEMKKVLAAQNWKLQEIERRDSQRSQQTVVQQFHALCDKNPEIFGTADSPQGSPEAIAREMMYHQLGALVNSQRHTTLEKDHERLKAAFVRQAAQQAPPATPVPNGRITPEQWERSGLAQTAHRNTAPVAKTRRQQIAERVDDEMRRNGIKVPAGSTSDLSDLPPR